MNQRGGTGGGAIFFKSTPYKTERPSTSVFRGRRSTMNRGSTSHLASAPAGLEGGMDWGFSGMAGSSQFGIADSQSHASIRLRTARSSQSQRVPSVHIPQFDIGGVRAKPAMVPSLNLARSGARAKTAEVSLSARGTRKEELDYLTSLLGSRSHRSGRGTFKAVKEEDEEDEGEGKDHTDTKRSPPRQTPVETKERPSEARKHLAFSKYKSLYDVATFSEFTCSQDFAGGGVAALCCITADRDSLHGSGAIKYMLDLLLNAKSVRAKCDALDAIGTLVKSRDACRELVGWKGRDTKTGGEYLGLGVIFRLKGSKYHQLQRAGISVVSSVLTSDALKHSERLIPEYMQGLCGFGFATDEQTGIVAGKALVSVMSMVLDQGIRWTEATLLPLIKLCRAAEVFPKVKTLSLKALSLVAKEGDIVCRILSAMGVVKAICVQLAARTDARIGPDDINAVRVVTQICEADGSRYEDVVVIGAVPRIIQILKRHLVEQNILLPHEQELQRRCGRFLEKVSTRPHLRAQVFQAGAASLFLSIMSMEHATSYVKESYALALTSLCDDPIVAASWLQDEPDAAQKMVQLLQGHDEELCLNTLSLVARLASVPEGAWALMSAKDLTAQVIRLLEEAGKMSEKQIKIRYLVSGLAYLCHLVQIPEGIKHIKTWNIIPKIDPFMRGIRRSLSQHTDGDQIWARCTALSCGTD